MRAYSCRYVHTPIKHMGFASFEVCAVLTFKPLTAFLNASGMAPHPHPLLGRLKKDTFDTSRTILDHILSISHS